MTRFLISSLLWGLAIGVAAAQAGIGLVAKRGVNCTPFNSFAIGYPLARGEIGGGTIVNQAVILATARSTTGMTRADYDQIATELLRESKKHLDPKNLATRINETQSQPGEYTWLSHQTIDCQNVANKITTHALNLPYVTS